MICLFTCTYSGLSSCMKHSTIHAQTNKHTVSVNTWSGHHATVTVIRVPGEICDHTQQIYGGQPLPLTRAVSLLAASPTHLPSYLSVLLPTCLPTYLPTYLPVLLYRTNRHTYIHNTIIHTYIHLYLLTFMSI